MNIWNFTGGNILSKYKYFLMQYFYGFVDDYFTSLGIVVSGQFIENIINIWNNKQYNKNYYIYPWELSSKH